MRNDTTAFYACQSCIDKGDHVKMVHEFAAEAAELETPFRKDRRGYDVKIDISDDVYDDDDEDENCAICESVVTFFVDAEIEIDEVDLDDIVATLQEWVTELGIEDDEPAKSEMFSNYTDGLCKDKQLSSYTYHNCSNDL